jgi:cystathionine beta-lyase
VNNPLTALTLAQLRERRSIKWRRFDPDVLPLWIAEMDTPLAEPIADALAAAVARGDTGYAHPGRLAEAFAGFAERRYGWTPDPARMLVMPDVMRSVAEILAVTSEPGDGVVVNTPVYPPFFSVVAMTGRRVVASPLARGDDGRYALDLEALDRDLGRPDVRVYLLCNPHNPSGVVARPDELAAVAEIAERHGVVVVADEIHAPLTYPGVSHTPFATVAGTGITLVSASKAWNLPGLKAALVVASGDTDWTRVAQVPIEATFGTGLFGVIAGEAAFTDGQAWLDALMAGLDENRHRLADLLARHLPGARYVPPEATFLAWLDLTALALGDDPAAEMLPHRVALANGPTFGDPGRGFARLNFATSPDVLAEAVRRMALAVPAA